LTLSFISYCESGGHSRLNSDTGVDWPLEMSFSFVEQASENFNVAGASYAATFSFLPSHISGA
jgi:hypothetical protein